MYLLISDQFLAPNRSTSVDRILSSSALHGPLIFSGFFTVLVEVDEESDEDESEEVYAEKEILNGSIFLEIKNMNFRQGDVRVVLKLCVYIYIYIEL